MDADEMAGPEANPKEDKINQDKILKNFEEKFDAAQKVEDKFVHKAMMKPAKQAATAVIKASEKGIQAEKAAANKVFKAADKMKDMAFGPQLENKIQELQDALDHKEQEAEKDEHFMAKGFQKLTDKWAKAVEGVADKEVNGLQKVERGMQKAIENSAEKVKDLAKAAADKATDVAQNTVEKVFSVQNNAVSKGKQVLDDMEEMGERVWHHVAGIQSVIKDGVKDMAQTVFKGKSELLSDIRGDTDDKDEPAGEPKEEPAGEVPIAQLEAAQKAMNSFEGEGLNPDAAFHAAHKDAEALSGTLRQAWEDGFNAALDTMKALAGKEAALEESASSGSKAECKTAGCKDEGEEEESLTGQRKQTKEEEEEEAAPGVQKQMSPVEAAHKGSEGLSGAMKKAWEAGFKDARSGKHRGEQALSGERKLTSDKDDKAAHAKAEALSGMRKPTSDRAVEAAHKGTEVLSGAGAKTAFAKRRAKLAAIEKIEMEDLQRRQNERAHKELA
eukprot:gnl/TRDRNA2_/TRDRNA2_175659_c0_seq2.p1 gnl/TRDRNA2_/TRDRNA2_175659_c0~~gnl/TRDRNA2_/TRDRNA2_175659_c0_seq2.p1  ORF type:complete len:573 (+),score=175.39 gnl/TRDRNA2_/TRDRNA2_175659_c0_seq2:219-1721(+)